MIIDFDKAKDEAFSALLKNEIVAVLSDKEKSKLGFEQSYTIWIIETEILGLNGSLVEITLYVKVQNDFPLSLPQIYLSQKDYNGLMPIPHVDSNRLICTYDVETTRTVPHNPIGILLESVKKAKDIVSAGVNKNNLNDFQAEFMAYWECNYGKNDTIEKDVLFLIDSDEISENITLVKLEREFSGFKYVLHKNDHVADVFTEFLNSYKVKYESFEAYNIGLWPFNMPPFNISNKMVYEIVSTLPLDKIKQFHRLIDKNDIVFVVGVVSNNDQSQIIGWFHKALLQRRGFREGKLTRLNIFKTFQSNDAVIRISPEIYTLKRINKRTNGLYENKVFRFVLIGLGSIGSNLYFYLNSFGNPEFKLIDPDRLKIGNINRHFLGFEYVGLNKAQAMYMHIKSQSPIQNVSYKSESIFEIIRSDIDFINETDFIFISIGKINLETWIASNVGSNNINKPVFFLWVEPYLAGGHCLYLNINSTDFDKYFDVEGDFLFNVIDKNEYKLKPSLMNLKEAGCQTSYTPYSANNVIGFLSSIFPKIASIIASPPARSICLSWIGDTDNIASLGIDLSSFAKNKTSWSLVQNEL